VPACSYPSPQPDRYRHYGAAAIDRLRFIRGAQRLGLRLREIAELLTVRDRGACPCGHTRALVRQRITELDAEIARLLKTRRELARLAAQCAAPACPDDAWPCEAEFIHAATNKPTRR
jgi:DNA-binding transcriptional MerR regulator